MSETTKTLGRILAAPALVERRDGKMIITPLQWIPASPFGLSRRMPSRSNPLDREGN